MKNPIAFELIPLDKVPSHSPIAKPVMKPRGSQWDPVLNALEQKQGKCAARIVADQRKRSQLKSTLQTIAKNRNQFVQVREDDAAIYAWMTLRDTAGRFISPKE